jgi:methyl-accepting chemotaxis protein
MSLQNTIALGTTPETAPRNKGAKVVHLDSNGASGSIFQRFSGLLPSMGVQQSFGLVGVLFLLPISLLLYYFVSELNNSVAFSAKERVGVVYTTPLLSLVRGVPEHQRFAAASLTGQTAVAGNLNAVGEQIDKSMSEVDAIIASQGDSLGLGTQWKSIRSQWQNLRAALPSMSIDQSMAAHNTLVSAINTYVLDVADKSNVTLDPDVDSYYLGATTTVLLPSLVDGLARLRATAMAFESGAPISEQERTGWNQLAQGGLEKSVQQTADALSRTFAANTDVQKNMETNLRSLVREVSEIAKDARDTDLSAGPLGLTGSWTERTDKLFKTTDAVTAAAAADLDRLLVNRVDRMQKRLYVNAGISIAVAALAIAILIVLARASARNARERETQATQIREENTRNQAAIMRLLDDMGSLADGDLTVKAKVTEDITGAIADSVNYTVGELRSLVNRVNEASTEVTEKSSGAEKLSVQLRDAAQRQAEDIRQASTLVLGVAASVKNVSVKATDSAKVAAESLSAAEEGGAAVENSIKGMNEMRENIQETSKRIKRLGESSQEIGEIVELISDITDQTNVLALNAAIQAAAAGEAGRGFAVVAEEVQNLAERSADATKQIGTLVKTIQRDTQDAVSAMERSTVGVVEGAKLADIAGESLRKIREVSNGLARITDEIFGATKEQSVVAENVANTMKMILDVTDLNTAGTTQVTESVAQLAGLATELKRSVSGFKI